MSKDYINLTQKEQNELLSHSINKVTGDSVTELDLTDFMSSMAGNIVMQTRPASVNRITVDEDYAISLAADLSAKCKCGVIKKYHSDENHMGKCTHKSAKYCKGFRLGGQTRVVRRKRGV